MRGTSNRLRLILKPLLLCYRQNPMDAFLKRTGASSSAAARRPPASATAQSNKGNSWERLFGASKKPSPSCCAAAVPKPKSTEKASKKRPLEQTYLDLGQRSFGRTVECRVCGFAYCEGEPSDEAAHRAHHKRATQGVLVRGVLAEKRILLERLDGARVVVHADDGAEAHRKAGGALLDLELGETPPYRRLAFLPLPRGPYGPRAGRLHPRAAHDGLPRRAAAVEAAEEDAAAQEGEAARRRYKWRR